MEKQWYVICTKLKQEKKVSALLLKKDIENYCPYIYVERKKAQKTITAYEPLFGSYVFVKTTLGELSTIKQIPSVINTLYWKMNPAVISTDEINAIKMIVETYKSISIEKTTVKESEKIGITEKNLTGHANHKLISIKHQGLIASLPSLGVIITAGEKRKIANSVGQTVEELEDSNPTKKFSLSFLFNF